MSEVYWQQLKNKVSNQIDFYWHEIKIMDEQKAKADNVINEKQIQVTKYDEK